MDMKKLIESMDRIEECGMTEMPAMSAPMQQGTPVSMNVSLNASGKEHVDDLINMMKNAGMSAAEPAAAKMLSPRMDMERLSGIMNGPMDEPEMEEIEVDEGAMKDELIGAMEKIAAGGHEVLDSALDGAMGPEIQKYLQDMYTDVSIDTGLHPDDDFEKIHSRMMDQIEDEYGMGENEGYEFESEPRKSVRYDPKQSMPSIMKYAHQPDVSNALAKAAGVDSEEVYFDDADLVYGDKTVVPRCGVDDNCTFGDAVKALKKFVTKEDYANEPDPEYGDMSDAIPNGNDLNRKKGAYKVVAGGDNPMEYTMEVESIKAALLKALTEKKAKPDFPDLDNDGNTKEPMKKAIQDKKKGSKPKKGQVPPQFKKK